MKLFPHPKILAPIIIVLLIGGGLFFENSYNKDIKDKATTEKPPQVAPSPESASTPPPLTQEQKEEYYEIYRNPYVIHIRTALTNYLAGNEDGYTSIASDASELGSGTRSGLDSFDKEYYKGRFVVLSNEGSSLMGDRVFAILFPDRPDQVFIASVYELGGGGYELRSFFVSNGPQGKELTDYLATVPGSEEMLQDRVHSL